MTSKKEKVRNLHAYVKRNASHAETLLERAAKAIEEAREHLRRQGPLEDELEPREPEEEDEVPR